MSSLSSLPFADAAHCSAAELRAIIRTGQFTAPTAGLARGHVQANLVILPADWAADFAAFCEANSQPCPLLEQTEPGSWEPRHAAPGADLRTDLPRYRVYRDGAFEADQPTDVTRLWQDDLVAFLIGCSFTFENALMAAGLPVRHIEQGKNVPMYRTHVPCRGAGRFQGPLVVSMRPYLPEQVDEVVRITSLYSRMHGAPAHVGDPARLGISDLSRPDFGDAVEVRPGETPVFWACGVTPQLAILEARPPLAITHSPGCMFVTDWRDEDYCDSPS